VLVLGTTPFVHNTDRANSFITNMKLTKTLVNNAGNALSHDSESDVDKYIRFAEVFDEYTKNHLDPLSQTTIEYTSIVYGHHLQELEVYPIIILYFKTVSDLSFEIKSGRKPDEALRTKIEEHRIKSEYIIQNTDEKNVFTSYVNEGVIIDLDMKERRVGESNINNWIIVFNWNIGTFITWDLITNDPSEDIKRYVEFEDRYHPEQGYEVLLVGSSQVSAVRQTHSRYFGLDHSDRPVLENINASIVVFSNTMDIDEGTREILRTLERIHFWGNKVIYSEMLRNHFYKGIIIFESSLEALIEKELVIRGRGVSLNIKKKNEINKYVN